MATFKLTGLSALIAAVETGSMRAAAARLGISQPAITKLIKELELETGALLVVRSNRGVAPTAHGLVLFEHANTIERELGLAQARMKALSGRTVGEIHISAVPVAIASLIPEAVRTFSGEFPSVRVRIHEELYPARLNSLRKGEVDITVGGIPAALPKGEFSVTPLARTKMIIVSRKGSPWTSASSLAHLQSANWIYTDAKHQTGYATDLFSLHGLTPPPCGAIVNSTLVMLALLASVDYVALLPSQLAEHPWARSHLQPITVIEPMLDQTIAAIVGKSDVKPFVRSFVSHLLRASAHTRSAPGLNG